MHAAFASERMSELCWTEWYLCHCSECFDRKAYVLTKLDWSFTLVLKKIFPFLSSWYLVISDYLSNLAPLVIAGIKLIFLGAVCMLLCFGYVYTVFSVSQTVPPAVEEAGSAEEAERGHSQDSRPQITHIVWCCYQGAQGEEGRLGN